MIDLAALSCKRGRTSSLSKYWTLRRHWPQRIDTASEYHLARDSHSPYETGRLFQSVLKSNCVTVTAWAPHKDRSKSLVLQSVTVMLWWPCSIGSCPRARNRRLYLCKIKLIWFRSRLQHRCIASQAWCFTMICNQLFRGRTFAILLQEYYLRGTSCHSEIAWSPKEFCNRDIFRTFQPEVAQLNLVSSCRSTSAPPSCLGLSLWPDGTVLVAPRLHECMMLRP